MLFILGAIAVSLTMAMYATKKSELGFACAIWWFIFGGHCYTLFTVAWVDIEYYMFFASMAMGIFTAIGAFALREPHDAISDEEMNEEGKGTAGFVDEGPDEGESRETVKPSRRAVEIRKRAENRRSRRSI